MKLFILAALIAVSSAARLEHLEQQRGLKEYLPPHRNSYGSFGSNDFSQNGLGSGDSTGFGSAPQGVKAGSAGVRGFSSFEAARSNQYLPPDHGPSHGGHGQDAFGASSNQFGSQSQFGQSNKFGSQSSGGFGSQGSNGFGSQGSNGFGSQGSNGFGSHGSQGTNGFGSHGSQSHFGSQGSNGFGSQSFGSQSSNGFGSQGSNGFRSQGQQYLAPKSSHDNIPQQAFDERTGYIY